MFEALWLEHSQFSSSSQLTDIVHCTIAATSFAVSGEKEDVVWENSVTSVDGTDRGRRLVDTCSSFKRVHACRDKPLTTS